MLASNAELPGLGISVVRVQGRVEEGRRGQERQNRGQTFVPCAMHGRASACIVSFHLFFFFFLAVSCSMLDIPRPGILCIWSSEP